LNILAKYPTIKIIHKLLSHVLSHIIAIGKECQQSKYISWSTAVGLQVCLMCRTMAPNTKLEKNHTGRARIEQVVFAGCRLQVETTCLFELKSNKPQYKG